MPIQERRKHYNALARRMNRPQGLKPGLLEKYKACEGNSKQRFEMMKAFLIDPDMILVCSLRPFVSAFPWQSCSPLPWPIPGRTLRLRQATFSAALSVSFSTACCDCLSLCWAREAKAEKDQVYEELPLLRSRTSGVSRMPARYSSNLTFWLLILMKTEAVVHFSCNFLYFFLYMCHILYHAS